MNEGRLFTLDEALEMLPIVRRLLEEIQAQKRVLERLTADLEYQMTRTSGNGHLRADIAAAEKAVQDAGNELQRLMVELDDTGAEIKGIDEGLVDFRSLRDGRVVYLCWQLGEETISYWHELSTGFAGRQPL